MTKLTTKDLHGAPMFTVFHNLEGRCAANPAATKGTWWDEFGISEWCDEDVMARARELEICLMSGPMEIECDDEFVTFDLPDGVEFNDIDGALCYLNGGGILAKLPDTMDSAHYRLYLVKPPEGSP